MSRIYSIALIAGSAFVSSTALAAPVVYQGQDAAGPGQARPLSDAAAAAFIAATPGANTITFERLATGAYTAPITLTTGVTYTAQNADTFAGIFSSDSQTLGYNTTAGGSIHLRYSSSSSTANTATFSFATAIDSFGAYFTGLGNGGESATLSFTDGTQQSFTLTGSSAVRFFGFTDLGASITSVSLNGTTTDVFGIDDVRYRAAGTTAAVPEPAGWAMMIVGFLSIGHVLRRRQRVSTRIRFS